MNKEKNTRTDGITILKVCIRFYHTKGGIYMSTDKRLEHVEQQLEKIENLLSQRQHRKRKTIITVILIILLLFLVVLGGLSFYLFGNGDSSTETETIIQEQKIP